jgi:hypothetical protein
MRCLHRGDEGSPAAFMCNAIKWSFAAAYVLALCLAGFGNGGWLGGEHDWLSPLMLLGLPWTSFIDSLGTIDYLSGVSPAVLATLAPAINLAILFSICSTLRRRRTLSKR